MFNSLTSVTADSIVVVNGDHLDFGTKAKANRRSGQFNYPATQQYGARTKKGQHSAESRKRKPSDTRRTLRDQIPPRPPLIENWPNEVLMGISESVGDYITNGNIRMPRF